MIYGLKNKVSKKDVVRSLAELAFGNCGDAVKLLYLPPEELPELDGLELRHIAEIHRNEKGGMVIKFAGRLELLQLLAALVDTEGEGESLANALAGAAAALRSGGDAS